MAKVSKAFLAKYKGKCPNCNQYWQPSRDWLNYVDNVLQHVKCPANGQSALGTTVKTAVNYRASINMPLDIEEAPLLERVVEDSAFEDDVFSNALASAIAEASSIDLTAETPRKEIKSFVPSVYQQAIFDAIKKMVDGTSEFRHLVVEAVAGSGKTTTMEKSLELIPSSFSVIFSAFNKHIADELDKRLKRLGLDHVTAGTLHRLGKQVLQKHFPKIKVEESQGDKVGDILDAYYPISRKDVEAGKINKDEQKQNRNKRYQMRKLISICKSVLCNVENVEEVLATIDRYGVEIDHDNQAEMIKLLPEILEKCKENTSIMDFDDMIWMPVVLNLQPDQVDFLMVDEFQDMNKSQTALVLKLVKDNGHIIVVGDRFQSLYGFRGADVNAIENIIEILQAKVLPLSVTYRCPASHVKLAQEIVPQLEARENAPEGVIEEIFHFDLVKRLQAGDMIICRTNAPLVKPAFECIRMKKKAMIRGKDIGSSLVNLVKRFEANDLHEFEISLNEYYENEMKKLVDRGKEIQILMFQDRVDTLRFIINESNSVPDVINKIEMLFSDSNSGIIFSSVHRAKGLEADNVYILHPESMPSSKAKKEWEKQQEMNCIYVAQTRSKANLIFVHGGDNVK